MHRLILLLAILPIFLAVVIRKLMADRPMHRLEKISFSKDASDTARKMLDSIGLHETEVIAAKKSWMSDQVIKENRVALPAETLQKNNVKAHGKAALAVGMHLLNERDAGALGRYRWARRFGHVFPIFTTLVVIFGVVVARIAPLLGLSIIVASIALATLAQFFTVVAGLQAASLVKSLLEKKRIFPRADDEEAVIDAAYAQAWYNVVPGIISRFVP